MFKIILLVLFFLLLGLIFYRLYLIENYPFVKKYIEIYLPRKIQKYGIFIGNEFITLIYKFSIDKSHYGFGTYNIIDDDIINLHCILSNDNFQVNKKRRYIARKYKFLKSDDSEYYHTYYPGTKILFSEPVTVMFGKGVRDPNELLFKDVIEWSYDRSVVFSENNKNK